MTELTAELLDGFPEDWLTALDPNVLSGFQPLLSRSTPEEAALEWIRETRGALLGEETDEDEARTIFDRVRNEVTALVCDDKRYRETRQAIKVSGAAAKPALVKVIAGAVAAALGLKIAIIAPPVAVILYLIARVGRKKWCNRYQHAI